MQSAQLDLSPAASSLAQRYLDAQLRGDRREALRLVIDEGLTQGMRVAELHLDVIGWAQQELGRLWQENRISVATEHLATAISQLVVAHLYSHLPRSASNGRRILVSCVEGEQHDMGPRLGIDFLEMAGFTIDFLGASVPTETLIRMVGERKPSLVALSITMVFHLPALERAVRGLREAHPDVPVVAGGRVFDAAPTLAGRLGLAAVGTRADELAAACCKVLGC